MTGVQTCALPILEEVIIATEDYQKQDIASIISTLDGELVVIKIGRASCRERV